MNRELQQTIRSIHRAEDPDDRRILTIAAADNATADPILDSDWYPLQSEGILHLETRDDSGGSTTAIFRPWFLEPGLSGEVKAGEQFTWDFVASEVVTLNVQGKSNVHLQLISKAGAGVDEFSIWGGVNTVEGA